MIRSRVTVVFAAVCWGATGQSADLTGAPFLSLQPSVRGYAMGGGAAAVTGAEALGTNPAGLADSVGRGEMYGSYFQPSEGANYGHAAAALRTSKHGALGVALTILQMTGDPAKDEQGNVVGGDTGGQDVAVVAAFAGRRGRCRWGAAVRSVQTRLAGETSNTSWGGDLGFNLEVRSLVLGMGLINAGERLQYPDGSDPLPTRITTHAKWDMRWGLVVGELGRDVHGQANHYSLGGEFSWGLLAARIGWRAAEGRPGDLFFGAGARSGALSVDFATGPTSNTEGDNNRLSLLYHW
jgi:hypothetical protein